MTAPLLTNTLYARIPESEYPNWCELFADGDRRLHQHEIALNVLGRPYPPTPGQLWERLRERETADRRAVVQE